MEDSELRRSARFSDTYYYGIQPLINSTVAEMDDMSMAYPTQEMYEKILDRVYDYTLEMYPEDLETQSENSAEDSKAKQSPFFRRRRVFRDLLGTLILFELLNRRRLFR